MRPDSEYAMHIALGLSKAGENRRLATKVRALWKAEEERRGGQLWAVHVKGHSGHVWNDCADRAAARGSKGFVRGGGARWSSWPPLPQRELRAHEVGEAARVMRARHAFGVLGMPVPVTEAVVPESSVRVRLARVERRLHGVVGAQAQMALQRARAAYRLLSEPTRQREVARKLITAGLQPATSELECPVNLRALEQYAARAGAEADAARVDKRGRPQGTLREIAVQFVARLAGRTRVAITYRHSLLGAELVAAGFVISSREYAFGSVDPFRLPRELRDVAFSGLGHDMDDAASYPRACLDVFRAGRAEAREFMAHREEILAGLGEYYFGAGVPASKRRKWVKDLFNSLDNDGTVWGWRQGHGFKDGERPLDGARVPLQGGRVFSLAAYVDSREDLTEEYEELMPGMVAFVTDWLRARGDARVTTASRTAKSYFLQEAEGLSRKAKVAWAALRGDVRVSNLQHDGVVVVLPDGVTAAVVVAGMAMASERILGYTQPVEEKPLGAVMAAGVGGGGASRSEDAATG